MRFQMILTLVSLFILTVFMACLGMTASSGALSVETLGSFSQPYATEHGSVSGKISSIGDASFAVEVRKGQDLVTFQFLVDDTTKVAGRLEVGSMATVEYRTDGVNNIALRVLVQPAVSH